MKRQTAVQNGDPLRLVGDFEEVRTLEAFKLQAVRPPRTLRVRVAPLSFHAKREAT